MSAREITSLEELRSLVGQEVAVGDWFEVTQDRINQFAEATGDHQWIHLDTERAKAESPYGTTIAHGFLTLSLLPAMMESAVTMSDVKMAVNYGLNKVRFPAPVPVGSWLRGRISVLAVDDIPEGAQVTWQVTVERSGSDKPVCVAELLSRRYS